MILSLLLAVLAPLDEFSDHWHDGKAEVSGYRFAVQRYGEPRVGRAITIYVTEPVSESARVKSDDANDAVDALKLNFMRDFPTGIYDYDTMTSLFVRTKDFSPLKTTYSSAEWCGHVFEQLVPREDVIEHTLHSYFENESTAGKLARPEGGVEEERLFVLLRGLRGAYLVPGVVREVPFLPGAFHRRLTHAPAQWRTASIQRVDVVGVTDVAGQRFEAIEYVVRVGDERTGRFFVELDAPHRILRWSWTRPDGKPYEGAHSGELTGTERMRYWKLNRGADAPALRRLGF
ncbi:MAG: hypothetical protein GY711_01465 [bacterium]|nr:hypothetical protein [bacterium]